MFRATLDIAAILVGSIAALILAAPAHANPCAEVEDESCVVSRPLGFSTDFAITCILFDGSGMPNGLTSRQKFERLAKTMRTCLTRHNTFDNRANESATDEILDRLHYRTYDGRETWSLTLSDTHDPIVTLRAGYETDAAKAAKQTSLSESIANILAAQACELIQSMETITRSNFANVKTKQVRGDSALETPLDGAETCLLARDRVRGENVISCTWVKEDENHAKWADDVQALRLKGARSCRKGWREAKSAFGVTFTGPNGEKLSLETRSGDAASLTGVSFTSNANLLPLTNALPTLELNRSILANAAKRKASAASATTPCAMYQSFHAMAGKDFAGVSTQKIDSGDLLAPSPLPGAHCVVRRTTSNNPKPSLVCIASHYGADGATASKVAFDRHVAAIRSCRNSIKPTRASMQPRYTAGGQAAFVSGDEREAWIVGYGKLDGVWYVDLGVSAAAR